MELREVEPLAEDRVRGELWELRGDGGVVFMRSAHKESVPWLLALCNSQIEQTVKINGVEAEKLFANEAGLIFERFEDP
jgi:hypothetical protein